MTANQEAKGTRSRSEQDSRRSARRSNVNADASARRQPPPHNLGAEEAVLGSLLMMPAATAVAAEIGVSAEDFYAPRHQHVAAAVFTCASEDGVCDPITVAERLRRDGLLEQVGGVDQLHALATATTWSMAMLPGHARIVVDNSRRRRLIHAVGDISAMAYDGEPVDAIVAKLLDTGGRLQATIPSGFTTLDKVSSKAIRWAWTDHVPVGEVTLLAGSEKVGKSLLCTELCARASRGQLEGDWYGTPVDCLYLTAEDRIEHVVKPRMQLAGADLSRIHVEQPTGGAPVTIARIINAIEAGVKLVILDPLVLFLPTLDDENTDLKVRGALAPVIGFSQQHDAATVGIKHVNKSEGRAVMNRVGGSRGYTAAVRAVLFVAHDPESTDNDNPDRLIFARGNLAPGAGGRRYRIEGHDVDLDDGNVRPHPRIVWKGTSKVTIDAAFARTDRGRVEDKDPLDDFLRDLLADGPVDAKDVVEMCENALGVTRRTALRHLKNLGGESRKVGSPTSAGDQRWEWFLPEGDIDSPKGSLADNDPFGDPMSPSAADDKRSEWFSAVVDDELEIADLVQNVAEQFGATVIDKPDEPS